MNKAEFALGLYGKLSFLSPEDIEEWLSFYGEMIDDRMEDGLSEEEAVTAIGSVDEIAAQIIGEIPLAKLVKERMKSKRRLNTWEIVLLVLGSPIWISLGITAAAVVLSLYISAWTVIISLWSAFASLAGCTLGGLTAGIIFVCTGYRDTAVAMIGVAAVCAGFAVFAFFGCRAATKGILVLTKKLAVWVKNCFVEKGDAE